MRVIEVLPGIFQLTPLRYVNLLVIARENLTLIDTGVALSAGVVLDFIRSLGRTPSNISLIIITHNHFDHVSGLPAIRKHTKAKVAAHVDDLDSNRLVYPGKVMPRLFGSPLFNPLQKYLRVKRDEVNIPLVGGETLDVLGGLEVIHTPGHTPGSISLYSRKERLMIVADALAKHHWRIDPPVKRTCYNYSQAMESVKKIAGYDFDTICFGHGRPFSGDAGERVRRLVL